MSFPYISRQKSEKFLENIEAAIKSPSESPLLHYAYGIGGIGKSTLIKKIFASHKSDLQCAYCSFDVNSRITTPIDLMKTLNGQLPNLDGWEGDDFQALYEKRQKAIKNLETEANEEKSAEEKKNKLELVKKVSGVLKWGSTFWATISTSGTGAVTANSGSLLVEKGIDSLTESVRCIIQIQDWVKNSKTAKDNLELQELLTNPLLQLTKAFIRTIINKSQSKPIVFFVDTYEKASSDFDTFFCQLLLSENQLNDTPVRIIMAGRYSLRNKRYQRMFQQYMNKVIIETQLDKFTEKETQDYLNQIGIDQNDEIKKIWKETKGYPYYLNLIREQKEQGKILQLSSGGRDIVDLLLDGLSDIEKEVVTLAGYCRWFDE